MAFKAINVTYLKFSRVQFLGELHFSSESVFINYVFFVFRSSTKYSVGLRCRNFREGSIKLKFHRGKNTNKLPNKSRYVKFFPITASCEAGRKFTSKQQMKTAAVKSAKDEI